jgi:hypothetical protein
MSPDALGRASGDSVSIEMTAGSLLAVSGRPVLRTAGRPSLLSAKRKPMTTTSSESPPSDAPPHTHFEIGCISVVRIGIASPGGTWVEWFEVPIAQVTPDYLRALRDTAGASNSEAFRGYEPGEVQFLGAVGERSGEKYVFGFHFAKWPTRSPALQSFAVLNVGA